MAKKPVLIKTADLELFMERRIDCMYDNAPIGTTGICIDDRIVTNMLIALDNLKITRWKL